MVLMIATLLHSIAVGNCLPSNVKTVCVDINPAHLTKLMDRGTTQAIGIVSDAGTFLPLLATPTRDPERQRRKNNFLVCFQISVHRVSGMQKGVSSARTYSHSFLAVTGCFQKGIDQIPVTVERIIPDPFDQFVIAFPAVVRSRVSGRRQEDRRSCGPGMLREGKERSRDRVGGMLPVSSKTQVRYSAGPCRDSSRSFLHREAYRAMMSSYRQRLPLRSGRAV